MLIGTNNLDVETYRKKLEKTQLSHVTHLKTQEF